MRVSFGLNPVVNASRAGRARRNPRVGGGLRSGVVIDAVGIFAGGFEIDHAAVDVEEIHARSYGHSSDAADRKGDHHHSRGHDLGCRAQPGDTARFL